MESKKDVYVKVDTKKKLKKFLKLIDMFGDKAYEGTLYAPWVSGKKEVTIKELRNILAAEHLKKGDYFIGESFGSRWVVKFDSICNGLFYGTYQYTKGEISSGMWGFNNFIRFATEEEIKSFESKSKEKELTIGQWYKAQVPDGQLYAVYKGINIGSYGIHPSDNPNWFDNHVWFFEYNINKMNYEPATTEEVTEVLIKEAKRRGYKVGNSRCLSDGKIWDKDSGQGYHYIAHLNTLYLDASVIFKDGKWAEIVEEKELTPDDYKDKTWYKRKSGSLIFIDKGVDSNLGITSMGNYFHRFHWFNSFQLNEFHVPGEWTEVSYKDFADIINKLNK